ncbi:hypothetical protein [Eggerthella guodeyinii]|uniref:Uncharacterized protein n=1 Tax=Eggerthella guodeyinii TaxID=2690837 RepID=A0A6N7RLR5_9ACTN|nr:hypothetical protein [Eggerthella guodeyinii]MRX82263.1 hypothetical protein [Eggerthella guodeyinii]
MATEFNTEDLVKAGTLKLMFERYARLAGNPSAARPHYNAGTGRYDNLDDWLALMADGRVYGCKSPLYAYSPVTTAIKIEANAGLVLEASTDAKAGRNDYRSLLFAQCPRVNGGYDKDGTPYVTAIEGYDDRFDAATANTWALTPVLYSKHSRDASYEYKYLTDTLRPGFSACPGAYTPGGALRPFILRACYMDSDGTLDSKSGTVPGAYYSTTAVSNRVAHCMTNDFTWSRNRSDGLTCLSFADLWYQQWMMEVMLGVKAPRSAAVGCVSYNANYPVAVAESGVKRVVLTDVQAAYIEIGSRISIGDGTQTDRYYAPMHSIAKSAKVVSKASLGNGQTAVNLDLASAIDVAAGSHIVTMAWGNGSCDGVLGTFGAPTAAGLTNGKFPFKFQNQEWQLGLYEVACDMYSTATVADGVATHTWRIAADVDACTGINAGNGWVTLDTHTSGSINNWRYIKDYKTEKGARVPENVDGTSTTGYASAWYPSQAAGDREHLVGGPLSSGALAGVGCAASNYALSLAGWYVGGRSSGLGHSAPCAE